MHPMQKLDSSVVYATLGNLVDVHDLVGDQFFPLTKRRQPTSFKCLWFPFAFNGVYRVALARHNEVHLTLLFVAPKMNLWQPGSNQGVQHEVLP